MFGLFRRKQNKNENFSQENKTNSSSKLVETLKQHLDCKIFKVINSNNDVLNWIIEPTALELIPTNYEDGYYIIQAILINQDKSEEICYMNMITPERISDYVIYNLKSPKVEYHYNFKNKDVIPNIASDCFGIYELYYSKINPERGIGILKEGLSISKEKNVIAEDLGYILRDEKRYDEALEAFLISEQNEPSSEYVFSEIENIYRAKGNETKAQEYKEKFEKY